MNRAQRQKRIRKKISGTNARPRLSVYRSLRGLWAQLIDDENSKTLLEVNYKHLKKFTTKIDQAEQLGAMLAELAKKKKITTIVFDRSGYRYHGRIKALAESARAGGLNF